MGSLGPWPRCGLCSVSRRLPSSAASSPMQRPPSILSAANPPVHRMHSPDGDRPCCGHTARAATVLTLEPLPPRRPPFAGSHPPGGGQSTPAVRRPSPWRPHPPCGSSYPLAVTVLPSRRSRFLRWAPSAGGYVPIGCHRPRASVNPPPVATTPPPCGVLPPLTAGPKAGDDHSFLTTAAALCPLLRLPRRPGGCYRYLPGERHGRRASVHPSGHVGCTALAVSMMKGVAKRCGTCTNGRRFRRPPPAGHPPTPALALGQRRQRERRRWGWRRRRLELVPPEAPFPHAPHYSTSQGGGWQLLRRGRERLASSIKPPTTLPPPPLPPFARPHRCRHHHHKPPPPPPPPLRAVAAAAHHRRNRLGYHPRLEVTASAATRMVGAPSRPPRRPLVSLQPPLVSLRPPLVSLRLPLVPLWPQLVSLRPPLASLQPPRLPSPTLPPPPLLESPPLLPLSASGRLRSRDHTDAATATEVVK